MKKSCHISTTIFFSKIYESNNLLSTPTSSEEKHFSFESIRRYLDISRHISRRWPYTIRYLESIHGEEVLIAVFDRFDKTSKIYKNLNAAACEIFLQKIKTQSPPIDYELLLYEDFRNRRDTQYKYVSTPPAGRSRTLVPFDLDSIYTTLMFYGRAHAPSIFYKNLVLEPGKTFKVRL
jgi:hypothetical protein